MESDNPDVEYNRRAKADSVIAEYNLMSRMGVLGANIDVAAGLAVAHQIGYTRGFEHGRTLAEFCEPPMCLPYFPMADSRPTAERLGWPNT